MPNQLAARHAGVTSHLDVVFLDVGGPLYSDRPYYEALLAAIKEVRPDVPDDAFWEEFDRCRQDQRGPFTRRLTLRFVPEKAYADVVERGKELWTYPPESLQPDVRPALEELSRAYRLGVRDFIPKPFTMAELNIRLRRILRERTATHIAQRTVLRGNIAGIGMSTLLSLLEYERKHPGAEQRRGQPLALWPTLVHRASFRAVWRSRNPLSRARCAASCGRRAPSAANDALSVRKRGGSTSTM